MFQILTNELKLCIFFVFMKNIVVIFYLSIMLWVIIGLHKGSYLREICKDNKRACVRQNSDNKEFR